MLQYVINLYAFGIFAEIFYDRERSDELWDDNNREMLDIIYMRRLWRDTNNFACAIIISQTIWTISPNLPERIIKIIKWYELTYLVQHITWICGATFQNAALNNIPFVYLISLRNLCLRQCKLIQSATTYFYFAATKSCITRFKIYDRSSRSCARDIV